MCGDCKIAPMTADDFDITAVTGHVTRDELGHDAVGDLPELEAVAVTDDKEQPDDGPEEGCLDGLRKPLAEQRQDQAAEENQQYDFQGKRADVVAQQIGDGILITACDQGRQRNSYAEQKGPDEAAAHGIIPSLLPGLCLCRPRACRAIRASPG